MTSLTAMREVYMDPSLHRPSATFGSPAAFSILVSPDRAVPFCAEDPLHDAAISPPGQRLPSRLDPEPPAPVHRIPDARHA